jgi:hypothetical protein
VQCKFSCSSGVNDSILQSIIGLTTIFVDKFDNRSLPLTKGGREKIVGRLSCFQNWGV